MVCDSVREFFLEIASVALLMLAGRDLILLDAVLEALDTGQLARGLNIGDIALLVFGVLKGNLHDEGGANTNSAFQRDASSH